MTDPAASRVVVLAKLGVAVVVAGALLAGTLPFVAGTRGGEVPLTIIKKGGYRNGANSRRVLPRNPASRPGRYCIRLSRVFTSTVSSAMVCLVRLASDRFRCAQSDSTGLSSWA